MGSRGNKGVVAREGKTTSEYMGDSSHPYTIPSFGAINAESFSQNYRRGTGLQDAYFTTQELDEWQKNGMLRKNEINVITTPYTTVHGKEPRGYGNWWFEVGIDAVSFTGNYTQAKEEVIKYAQRKRRSNIRALS